MITDDQGTQILKRMDEQFTKVDEQFKEVNKRMDEQFTKVDEQFKDVNTKMDEQFKEVNRKMDEGFQKVGEKLDIIEMYVANHDNALKALPTREEFEKHQEENLNFQYAVAKKLELKEFAKA